MCGIIGYNGEKNAVPILMGGLERLEYRGYDSAGVAVSSKEGCMLRRAEGRLTALKAKLSSFPLPFAGTGIAHTRWATHGEPSDRNAHPHRCGRVTLVHNGIVENYGELKAEITRLGRTIKSDTDSELIAHLLDEFYDGDALAAIRKMTERIRGSYALTILFDDRPEVLYAVREGSPLIVGYGDGENFVASDLTAILGHTRRYTVMDSREIAEVERGEVRFFGFDGEARQKDILFSELSAADAEKGAFAHFMRKEIYEQPEAIRRTVRPYLSADALSELFPNGVLPDRIVLCACGSAMHACLCGKRFFEGMARIPCEVHVASEFRYSNPVFTERTLAVIVSQSGETADTLAALRLCRERGVPTVAVVNVPASSIAREADRTLFTLAGPEIAVATTKAYTAQVALLSVMAMHLARQRNDAPSVDEALLRTVPALVHRALDCEKECSAAAEAVKDAHDIFFIGRGRDYDACAEGSLKLKEISYLHSEAYAAGELKHGTISLVRDGVPVFALITDAALREKTVGNMREVKARGAYVILLAAEDAGEIPSDAYDRRIALPGGGGPLSVLPAAVVLQLIAYHVALRLGCDIDKPRNLAKSVTVE